MAKIYDLPEELVGEILVRGPLTSLKAVRSTSKKWNALFQNQILGKETVRKQFLGFMVRDSRVCSLRFDLDGICNNGDFVDPYIKQIREFNKLKVGQVLYHDGLLVCVINDPRPMVRYPYLGLMVWNPYLGQIRWINKPIKKLHHRVRTYAFGYDDNNDRNHKILRFLYDFYYAESEIYDFSSKSWRVLDVNPDSIITYEPNVSLKGNTYFFAEDEDGCEQFLICFDFTAERFGPRLPLPFHVYYSHTRALSCVRDEQLAVLYQHCGAIIEVIEIWVSIKIEPNEVSWSKFLKVDMTPINGILDGLANGDFVARNFFIDEEKKVVVGYDTCQRACIINGEDGYFKSVKIKEDMNLSVTEQNGYNRLVCFPYVPSLVQLQIKQQQRKRKQRD